jgi:ATP synthase subunit 6
MVSTPIPSTDTTSSTTSASNRVISNWIAAREWAGMGTLSWITSLFAVILASNSFGLIPFSEAITGKAGLTLGLSFAVWGAVTYTAIATQGTKTVNMFLPGGINWQMAPLFVLLEMISYSFRAISLGVRLWANMLAGHQLIHIVTGISLVPVFVKAPTLLPVSLTAAGLLFAMTGLETIVCVLQSGVFCLLTSFYLAEALHKKTHLTPQPLAIKA